METTEKNPTNYDQNRLCHCKTSPGLRHSFELKTAEKLARRRLSELEAIVKGISAKWFKGRHDTEMLAHDPGRDGQNHPDPGSQEGEVRAGLKQPGEAAL